MAMDDPYFNPTAIRENHQHDFPEITNKQIEQAIEVFWSTYTFNVDAEAFWDALGRCQSDIMDLAIGIAIEDAQAALEED